MKVSFYCPNVQCENMNPLKEREFCPQCNCQAQRKDESSLNVLLFEKGKRVKGGAGGQLVNLPQMSDEEIGKAIIQDMRNLAAHEAGTAWMRLGTLLSFDPTQQMLGAGFKALIDQNKIVIRQNELLLRELRRLREQKPRPP